MFPSCHRPCPAGVILLLSAKSGDLARTKALLRHGSSSDDGGEDVLALHPDTTRDARGNTPLHLAAIHGHCQIAQALLDAHASTEAVVVSGANEGLTPLRLAAERGHLSTVRVLLAAGADTGAEDLVDRATPLHAAAEAGHTAVVVELATRGGANLEARAVSGQTPLRWCLSMGRAGAAAALLNAGADPDAPDRHGACCLHTVAGLKSDDTNRVGDIGDDIASPIVLAKLLLSAGATPNLARSAVESARGHVTPSVGAISVGETPLHVAARESSVEVAKVLLLYGADANIKTSAEKGGFSPLHCAAAPGNDESRRAVVRALLEAGAAIDAVSTEGLTPLRLACLNASVGCVEELLRWGADDVSCVPRRSLSAHSPLPVSSLPSASSNHSRSPPIANALVAGDNLVGSRVPVYAKDATECQAILHMLSRAPSDRAWRRRGWLVLLYSRANAAAVGAAAEQVLAPPCLPSAKRKCLRQDQVRVRVHTEAPSVQVKEDELRGVVARLFEVQGDQSVFRRVIEWL